MKWWIVIIRSLMNGVGWSPFYSVPKGKMHTFPALLFRLGEEDVTITGYDYTICGKRS